MKQYISKKAISAAIAALLAGSLTGTTVFAYSGDYDYLLTFNGDTVTASTDGNGAADTAEYSIDGTTVTIAGLGTYVVTGSSDSGSISIKKNTDGVTLVFEDLTLSYAGDTENTDTVTVGKNSAVDIVIEGENTISNSNEDGAVIKIKSGASVTITGDGELTADASEGKNGIKGAESASLIIGEDAEDGFTLTVSAANNGIASDGSVTVNGGTVNITSSGDGLKSSPDEGDETSEGTVTINNGTVSITSAEDGVQADGGFTMNDGTLTVTAGGGASNAANLDEDTSAKGIKSDSYIIIAGGDITIDSADDGIHLNGTTGSESVDITSGTITIRSGDDGIHSDYTLNVGTEGSGEGPSVNVEQSYEGLEGAVINLNSGEGNITASDDGINAANSDLDNYDFEINISGGTWYVNAGGDGIDSNGDLNVSGGDTIVFGSADNGNAALDVGDNNNQFSVTGGSIAGIGMSGMSIYPSDGTYLTFGSAGMGGFGQQNGAGNVSVSAGSTVEIRDQQGNTVWSAVAVKSADSIVYASSDLTAGGIYTLYVNGSSVSSVTASSGNGSTGGMGGQPGGMGGQQGQFPAMPGNQNDQNVQQGQFPAMPGNQNDQGSQQGQFPAMPDNDTITVSAPVNSGSGRTYISDYDYTESKVSASVTGSGTAYGYASYFTKATVSDAEKSLAAYLKAAGGKVDFTDIEALFDRIGYDYKGSRYVEICDNLYVWYGWSAEAADMFRGLVENGTIVLTIDADNAGEASDKLTALPAARLLADYKNPHYAPVVISLS